MNIGMALPFFTWNLAVGYSNAFNFAAWAYDADNVRQPVDMDEATVQIRVLTNPETLFTAITTDNIITFALTPEEASVDLVGKKFYLEVIQDDIPYLWSSGRVAAV